MKTEADATAKMDEKGQPMVRRDLLSRPSGATAAVIVAGIRTLDLDSALRFEALSQLRLFRLSIGALADWSDAKRLA
jgi:hypothetical protein